MHRDVYTAQLFAGIERAVDVNRFMVGGTSLWGLFRTLMYFPLREALERDRVSREVAARLRQAFPDDPPMDAAVSACDSALDPAAFPDGPIVVLAAGPGHTRIVDGMYESPIADAWVSRLLGAGLPVCKLDAVPSWLEACQPRRYPSFALPGTSHVDELAASEVVATEWVQPIQSMFAAVNEAVLRTVGISLESVLAPFVERVMRFVAERFAAERWLRALRPRAIFLLCYYETCYLPIISAARGLGIPTVDLQHGMNGTVHGAYTHFTALPPDGYDVLPDCFLTWGSLSSQNITRWWSAATRHRVMVGGRYDIAVANTVPANDTLSALESAARQAACRVLITMQDEPFDRDLLDAMRGAPPEWLWLVRPHPASARYPLATAAALEAQLQVANVTNAVVVSNEQASLADLLRLADVHVTWASSSWLDAAVFEVPTVFVHPGAGEQFFVELSQGLAFAPSAEEPLVPLVSRLAAERVTASGNARLAAVVDTDETMAQVALSGVFGTAWPIGR